MTITYPLSFPRMTGMATIELTKSQAVGETESPYDGTQQTQVYDREVWMATITLPSLNRNRAPAWEAFIAKLGGKRGTFLLEDPARRAPRGAASANILTDGSGQYLVDGNGNYQLGTLDVPVVDGAHSLRTNSIAIKGLRANISKWLMAGDYIQLRSGTDARLHQVLDDVNSDGAGKATLLVWPRTRYALINNEAVVFTNCKSKFKLTSNEQTLRRRPPCETEISFSCKESLP